MADLFLILTATQAQALAGPTADGAALAPMALADGMTFVLPQAVMSDPAHAPRHAALSALPLAPVAPEAFPTVRLAPA